ncbi:MAG TPA: glycosyltransferase family 2 protein [Acidimicrobiales bacterium]|nr:glycosyltransferase family 2 protein [Acidimicrobiales bacterium]
MGDEPLTPCVVVVTWQAASTVSACLASVPPDAHVIVVDNASEDGTVEIVRAARPDAVVIENQSNLGFAAAANQGIRAASALQDIVLLNPDAVLAPGAVAALATFAAEHPRVAATSALIVDDHGRAERFACGRDPTLLSVAVHEAGAGTILPSLSLYRGGPSAQPEKVDWVAGTAVLLRRRALDTVGLFDERYFLYAEDIDWCRRARQAGWECWINPAAVATHAGSAAVSSAGNWVDRWRLGSLDTYIGETRGSAAQIATRAVRVAGALARTVVFFVVGQRERARARLRDARTLVAAKW